MTVKQLYAKLMNYEKESIRCKKFCSAFGNGWILIHRKGDLKTYYLINKDKIVTVLSEDPSVKKEATFEELTGDDFEFFNPFPINKAGYLVFKDTESLDDVQKILIKIYDEIDTRFINAAEDEDTECEVNAPTPHGCLELSNGGTDHVSFQAVSGTYVEVRTIPDLCKTNVGRKYWGCRCLPFKKEMDRANACYVEFHNLATTFIEPPVLLGDSENALTELLDIVKSVGYEAEWVDMGLTKLLP